MSFDHVVGGSRATSRVKLQTLSRRGLAKQVLHNQTEQTLPGSHVHVGTLAWVRQQYDAGPDGRKWRRLVPAFLMGSLAVGVTGSYYTMKNWSVTNEVSGSGHSNPSIFTI